MNEKFRNNIEAIRNSYIDTYDGEKIPLSFVADVVSVSGPIQLTVKMYRRKLVVSANVAGRDVGSVVDEIKETICNRMCMLPDDYFINYGGQFESAQTASQMLLITSILAIIIIYIILYQEFKSACPCWLGIDQSAIGNNRRCAGHLGHIKYAEYPGYYWFYHPFWDCHPKWDYYLYRRYQHLRIDGWKILDRDNNTGFIRQVKSNSDDCPCLGTGTYSVGNKWEQARKRNPEPNGHCYFGRIANLNPFKFICYSCCLLYHSKKKIV